MKMTRKFTNGNEEDQQVGEIYPAHDLIHPATYPCIIPLGASADAKSTPALSVRWISL